MYTIEKRKLIYIMTRKPVWVHRHYLTPGPGTPIWYDPFWVIGNCELCKMDIEAEDGWSNVSYNNSQRKLFDSVHLDRNYWYCN